MATLEDKILGNKLHNYCSSSSSSSGSEDEGAEPPTSNRNPEPPPPPRSGTSSNTGPKGVLNDWQKYKNMEQEKFAEQQKSTWEYIKKTAITVEEDPSLLQLDDDNDEFLIQYQKQRMQEMLNSSNGAHSKKFGQLVQIRTRSEYLEQIDNEEKTVTIVVHIYETTNQALTKSLQFLSRLYESVKFCTVQSSTIGMSERFKIDGVPALLVYKNGELIGNFIKFTDDLGQDFYPEDLQAFLVEHGLLEDRTCKPSIVRGNENSSSDDDL